MNAGIIPPDPGYLEGVRELTRQHGVLLTFDEVKTGLTTGPGGATALLGVQPDLVTLAKSLGGGVPCGAIGGTEEAMGHIVEGHYEQVGTFNGNPLTMAAARAVVTEVLDDAAYQNFGQLWKQADAQLSATIEEYELDAYTLGFGAKGCVTFSAEPVRNYRGYLALEDLFSHAHWLFQHNGGVFLPPWGKSEQWTMSVQHTAEDISRLVDNFARFARALRG
jgi:glutamate-1-semialdehyde 2,1-aminomutase